MVSIWGPNTSSGGYACNDSTRLGPNLQYAYDPGPESTQEEASGDACLFNLACNTNDSISMGGGK